MVHACCSSLSNTLFRNTTAFGRDALGSARRSGPLGYFCGVLANALQYRCRDLQNSAFRVLPALGPNCDSVGLRERFRNHFKFLSIKTNSLRCRISKMFHARTNIRESWSNKMAHDEAIIPSRRCSNQPTPMATCAANKALYPPWPS